MADLIAFQATATCRSALAATLTDDDVEAFTDTLAHDACVALGATELEATFTVWAKDVEAAKRQARILAGTASIFSLPRSLARWDVEAIPYLEVA
jgi:hypothetical protein